MSAPIRVAIILWATTIAGCKPTSPPIPQASRAETTWKVVATFSGHGNAQLETFPIERFTWRVRWQTEHESPPGAGEFYVTAHSGDSGRLLAEVVDARGNASDVAYISELPHRYYLVVKSAGVDWSLIAEEPVLP